MVSEDLSPLHQARVELGDDGLPLVAVERTPYQQLWIQWVSIEDLACHLMDCPGKVRRCMAAMRLATDEPPPLGVGAFGGAALAALAASSFALAAAIISLTPMPAGSLFDV